MAKLWFKRKRYGWGWTPASIEGWLTMVVFLVAINVYPLWTIAQGRAFSTAIFAVITLALAGLLIALCLAKGEKPEWSWGDKRGK